ncbi:MAG: protein kinase [Acidobacteriota bacterium]
MKELMQDALSPGTIISHYRSILRLGAGGMGEVYLAEDTKLDRKVAIKLLPPESMADERAKRRLIREAQSAAMLDHPNICSIYEVGEEGDHSFIVMQYVKGETLAARIQRKPMDFQEALDVAAQVADALAEAHSHGIIHRDIKPQNIMITPRGQVKVMDFGLAKAINQRSELESGADTQILLTEPGLILGTIPYMSPEQVRGETLDDRSDIFSFGAVVYEMVSGRQPFAAESAAATISTILTKEPPPLARFEPSVPNELQRIVTKALRKNRDERYQTVKDLLIDLRSLKEEQAFEEKLERSRSPESASQPPVATGGGTAVATADQPAVRSDELATARTTSSAEYMVNEIKRHKTGAILALAAFVVVVTGVALGLRYIWRSQSTSGSAEPFSKMRVTRLTNHGRAAQTAISPDGKYVVHVMGNAGQQSIWLRHIATGSDKEIVPSVGRNYAGLTFSHDGGYIYYQRAGGAVPNVLYQVAVLGGAPVKVIEDIDSAPTFSPDGKRFAFVRGYPPQGEAALMIANVDGTGEQKLASYDISNFFPSGNTMRPAWSPDGEVIALGVPASDAQGSYRQLLVLRVKNEVATPLTSQRWSALGQFAWLADGSGFVVTASDQASGSPRQIWYVSYPDGLARPITNDVNDYFGLSLTEDSAVLATVQTERLSNIWVAPNGEASRATQITSNRSDGITGIAWAPDGRIVYGSNVSGNPDIWVMNADGSDPKQLTVHGSSDVTPSVCPDRRYIVFVSSRTGAQSIWRMDRDGGNPRQLSDGTLDDSPSCSPDGRWVVFTSSKSGKQTLWKVPIDGGDAVQLLDFSSGRSVISPDGEQVAYTYTDQQSKRLKLAVMPFEGGAPTKTFEIPTPRQAIRWAPDGRALTYIDARSGVSNLWSQPLDGGPPKQLTNFKSDQIFSHAWSSDGKQLMLARGTVTSDVVLMSNLK